MIDYDEKLQENNIPKRTDERYKLIENFKPYELTHCIVFEMACRNKDVKNLIIDIIKFKRYVHPSEEVENYLPICNLIGLTDVPEFTEEECKQYFTDANEFTISLKNISQNKTKLKNDYYIYFEQNERHFAAIHQGNKNLDTTGLKIEHSIKLLDTFNVTMTTHNRLKLWSNDNQGYETDYSIYEGFVVNQGIDQRSKTYNLSVIEPNFNRKIFDTNQIDVTLNMSLPEDELVAYIRHIKKTLSDENTKEFKSPNKLLGKKVQDAKKIVNYPKKPTAKKLAEMFFVYDYVTARLDDYRENIEEEIAINEIFDGLESLISISYYLKEKNKDSLDPQNDQDMIFEYLLTPLYREKIKQVQRRFNKKNIHTKINEVCNIFKDNLDASEISVITKKYSKKIENPKKNKIFDDLETILYKRHKKNIENQFSHIEKEQIDQLITDIETHINQYKISSSTASNYYYALKPYIEDCRYPEFLTGESIIEDTEDENNT